MHAGKLLIQQDERLSNFDSNTARKIELKMIYYYINVEIHRIKSLIYIYICFYLKQKTVEKVTCYVL